MRLRKEQMEAFERYMREGFARRVLAHLRRYFPEQCAQMGKDELREFVHYGIERAGSYGIEAEADVARYIDLMMEFGQDFDSDLTWAAEILNDESIEEPAERMDRLCQRALSEQRRE